MKLTSFFKKFVSYHRDKKKYNGCYKLKEKKIAAASQVSVLCERFTEMRVAADLNNPSSMGQDVVKYVKTQLL